MIRVLVADDQELVREGVAAILGLQSDIAVVGTAADGAEALGLIQALDPDVALMDIRMPVIDGIQATRRLIAARTSTRVLILTTYDSDDLVLSALRAGASGFLLKDAPRESLLASVRAVASGDVALEDSVLRTLVAEHLSKSGPRRPDPALERLTPRESEVLVMVGRGFTNSEIAKALSVSVTTVKTHIARTLAKVGARDRIALVVMAHRSGLV
jgi:DNA-binding NarL/FixJ family response regulator